MLVGANKFCFATLRYYEALKLQNCTTEFYPSGLLMLKNNFRKIQGFEGAVGRHATIGECPFKKN